MPKYIKVGHIKELYVKEACCVVGVPVYVFFFFFWLLLFLIAAAVGLQPVAPVKPPVVAEWGSGVTPRLDPDTISKHVKQMVDVSIRLCSNFHFLITRVV